MKLPGFLGRVPPKFLALGAAGIAILVIAVVVLSASGGGNNDDGNTVVTRPTPSTGGPDVAPTETPVPVTATPLPNRQDCAAIRGTPYLSDDEEAWFKANCGSFDGPAVQASGGAQPPLGDRLIIASANVNAEVSRATVPTSGQMPDPVGYFNAVWYDFGAWPGLGGYVNAGNMVLSGHVDCAHCYTGGGSGTAVFWSVRNLKPGDKAEYRTADGRVFNYVVTESRALSPSADFETIVASSTADMTLITCTGTFTGGEYNQRHVVSMKKV